MHKPEIAPLLYAQLYPYPLQGDPQNFTGLISRHLLPEVRAETARFYGADLRTLEAQYPALDYNNPGHRLRLSEYTWHRRLFRAFDALHLTPGEINELCRWEGTKHARTAFELRSGTIIRDTTWDGVEVYDANPMPTSTPNGSNVKTNLRGGRCGTSVSASVSGDDALSPTSSASGEDNDDMDDNEEGEGEQDPESEDDDLVERSVGTALNQRLLAATAARARGEDVVLDPAWEQWMKEAAERGAIPAVPDAQSAFGASASASAAATAAAASVDRTTSTMPGVFRWDTTPQSRATREIEQAVLRRYGERRRQTPLQSLRPASRLRPRSGTEVMGGQS